MSFLFVGFQTTNFGLLIRLLITCLSVYILSSISTAIYYAYFHRLAKFPGPKLWAISRIPWAYHVIKGDLYNITGQFHSQYGPVVRIGPDELTITSPKAWNDIYIAKPLMPKDPYSQTPPLNGAHSLFTAAGDTHKRIRSTLIHSFSDKALQSQSTIIEHYADQLVSRLKQNSDSNGESFVDIQKFYSYTTFDIVTDLSFGESFHGLEQENEHSWIQGFFFHAKFGTIRNCLSRFFPLDLIFGIFLLGTTRKSRERNWKIVTSKIEKRLNSPNPRLDFIAPAIGKIVESGPIGITKQELITNGLAFVIADCQLTTVALTTITYLLLRDKSKLEHLMKEIRGLFKSSHQITVQSTQNLVYLEAVINEAIRLHHPTPIGLPRVVEPEGRKVSGYFVPGNTVIGINLQNIQNDPSLWVEPRVFHPERFLPPSDSRYDIRFDSDIKEAFIPFSTGPRNCVGKRMFFAQAKVILAKIIWNFELEMFGKDENWLDQKAYLVFEPKPLHIRLRQLSHNN